MFPHAPWSQPAQRTKSRLRPGSLVLAKATHYLPTFIIDDKASDATGECSLFVREYRLIQTKAGNRRLEITPDVLTFADEVAMVAAITTAGIEELPAEAEEDRLYVPEDFREFDVKPQLAMGRSVVLGAASNQERPPASRQDG